jgi:phosphoribosylamine--glycine ligase
VDEARAVLSEWYGHNRIPGGGSDVLLEQRLAGREVSVFALCDGRAMVPMGAACDYKRAGDADTGPNTGGMGAYSPPAGLSEDLYDRVRERILAPLLRGLLAEGEEYVGVLYCGLMWTADGPHVIEFNVRFGDPEAQVLLPRIGGDFAALLASVARGSMDLSLASETHESCVGVVLATSDYPRSNTPLKGLHADVSLSDGCRAFWGASQLDDGEVSTGGGRVLTVTALGDDLADARLRAYQAVKDLAGRLGTGALTYRTDIALSASS